MLQINDDLVVGGVERVVVNLAVDLHSRGHRVGVMAELGGALWGDVPDGVRRFELEPRGGLVGNLRWVSAIRRAVRDGSWQVVHVHQRALSILARLALVGSGVPVVEHVHSLFEPTPVARMASFRGDRLIACGSQVRAMLEEGFGRRPDRISVVTNAVVDPGERERARSGVGEPELRIVGIGRLSEEKDPFRFVDVVAALRRLGIACSARWFGDGPLRADVEEFVRSAGPEHHVSFPGVSTKVASEIAAADVVLLTSKREGLPLTILEGMGVGRAVVTPDVGSCRDVIIDGETGVLYDPSLSASEIAAKVAAVYATGDLAALGPAARKYFVENCSLEIMTQRVVDQYEIALRGKRLEVGEGNR
ncbi:glycosyltransferase [Actinomycetospora succinea]|uniref:glycosyltransferase n=1 Tax=Actinomycetospora succinea TaxID=663603 RepID=UPI0031ED2C8D